MDEKKMIIRQKFDEEMKRLDETRRFEEAQADNDYRENKIRIENKYQTAYEECQDNYDKEICD